jgi:hypothetical protein
MSRSIRLAFLLVPFLAATACKKDGDVQASLDLLDKHGKEITAKVTTATDKKAGVADAQKYLDSNKDDLNKRMKEMSELRGFQVSEDMQSKMAQSLVDAAFMCGKIQVDLMSETMSDKDLDASLEKLCKDWQTALDL